MVSEVAEVQICCLVLRDWGIWMGEMKSVRVCGVKRWGDPLVHWNGFKRVC